MGQHLGFALFPLFSACRPVLDTATAAHFLSVVGLLFEVGLECALNAFGVLSRRLSRDVLVEQEAEGELGHWFGSGRGSTVRLPGRMKGFWFYNLCRKDQEARTIPGDRSVVRASALAEVPVP